MANFYAADYGKKLTRAAQQGGNGFNESYRYVFTAIAAASVVYFGVIPAGVEINEVAYQTAANAASLTMKLGFTPINSTDGPTADDDYWFAASTAITSAQRAVSVAAPIVFEFPVAIILTTADATATAAVAANVIVSGKIVGIK